MDLMNDDEFIDGLFAQLMPVLADADIQKLITIEQKRALLNAMNVTITESDSIVTVTFLFVTMTLDIDTGGINITVTRP